MLDSEKAQKIRSFVREKSIKRNVSNGNIAAERLKPASNEITKMSTATKSEIIISRQLPATIATSKLSGPTISNIKSLNFIVKSDSSMVSSLGMEDFYSVTAESNNFQKSFLHSVGNSIAEENDDILPRSPTYLNVRPDSTPLTLTKAVEKNKLVVIKHQQQI